MLEKTQQTNTCSKSTTESQAEKEFSMFKGNNSDITMTVIDTDLFLLFDISYPFLV